MWNTLAAGALYVAGAHAARADTAACVANVGQALLAAAQGRLAARGEWALNEKGLVERAGLDALSSRPRAPAGELEAMVADVSDALALPPTVWTLRS